MTDQPDYPRNAFGGDTIATVTLTQQERRAYASGWNRAIEAAAKACRDNGMSSMAGERAIRALSMPAPAQAWQTDMNAMPKGVAVLAALSNGWHEIITDRSEEGDFAGWYIAHGNVSLPIERTHPSDTNWECTIRAVAWMPLPAPPAALIPDTEGV